MCARARVRAQNDHFCEMILQSSLLVQPWRQDELFPSFAGRDTALECAPACVCVCVKGCVCVMQHTWEGRKQRDKRLHLSECVVLATY